MYRYDVTNLAISNIQYPMSLPISRIALCDEPLNFCDRKLGSFMLSCEVRIVLIVPEPVMIMSKILSVSVW